MTTSQHQEELPRVTSPLWSVTTVKGAKGSQLQGGGSLSLRSSLGVGVWWGAAAVGCHPGIKSLLPEVSQPQGEGGRISHSPQEPPSPQPCSQALLNTSQDLGLPKQAIPRGLAALGL